MSLLFQSLFQIDPNSNEYLLALLQPFSPLHLRFIFPQTSWVPPFAKFGFDTAVKLPFAILTRQQFRVQYYYRQSSFRTPLVPSVFEDNPGYRRRRRHFSPLSFSLG